MRLGIHRKDPVAKLKPERTDRFPVVRFLSPAEEDRLMAALDAREERLREERDRANAWRRERGYAELPDLRAVPFADLLKVVVLVSLNTGCRRNEVFSLQWRDVDLDRGFLSVRGESAKSGATRHVPLNQCLRDALADWKAQTTGQGGLVFPTPKTGGKLDNLNSSWRALLKAAQIEHFRWHDQRHHFASKLVMAGASLNSVRALLGHASMTMTVRYAHLSNEHLIGVVELLDRPANVVAFTGRAQEPAATTGEKTTP